MWEASGKKNSYSRNKKEILKERTGVAVPLRVGPSPTGLPSKTCPGIGFLLIADREMGSFRIKLVLAPKSLPFLQKPGAHQITVSQLEYLKMSDVA